jgi:acyl-homoserine-lactone acylase
MVDNPIRISPTNILSKLFLTIIFLLGYQLDYAQSIDPQSIEIIRDKWGVPHIYAPTDAEVAYGLAWAHSEDDFQTIQQTLLASKQMLGRHMGKTGAPIDYVVGLLDCDKVVSEHLQDLSPDFVKVMEGYIAGINAYAEAFPNKVLVKRSFPVNLHEMMRAYVLSLAVMLGADRTIQSLFENNVDNIWDTSKGSNGFAFSRSRTTDGNVYLAVNAHQPLEGPTGWYEAHLISDEGWNALGGLFPGGSTIFLGTNEHLGWAHTVNHPDKIDIWQLKMHPFEENLYYVDNEWLELEERIIKLKVKLIPGLIISVKKKAYRSIYGPVVKNENGVYAFDMAALHDLRAPEQWYRMNKATNFQEFKSALDMMALPMFNIVYADRYDDIFYTSNALLPKRNPDYDWGEVVPGVSRDMLYNGYYQFDDLPQVYKPASGYVYNTNHSPFLSTEAAENPDSAAFDPTMGYKVWNNNRSIRLKQLIDEHPKLSYEDFVNIKYDVTLPEELAFFMNLNGISDLVPAQYPELTDLINLIQQWDRTAEVKSIGPPQVIVLYYYLLKQIKIKPPNVSPVSEDQLLEGLEHTRSYFMKHFDKIEVSLGEYQKLVRGDKELPLHGMPDVLAAMYSAPYKKGRVRGIAGDSYIQLVRFPEEGLPLIESIHAYGASNQPESLHYTDQMELFVNKQRKSMTLDLDEVRENAERIYHPVKN